MKRINVDAQRAPKRKSWKTDLVLRGQSDPVWWITNILGDRLWSKQEEICRSIVEHERTAVAACVDRHTEILTETRGWQLFKDLLSTDKVASLQDNQLKFVKPLRYFVYLYEGELLGCKSKDLNFLVTPNHHCYVSDFDNSQDFVLKSAEECYGKELYFNTGNSIVRVIADDWIKEKYDGGVYCVEVPSHIIFVKREGCSHWTGNSFGVGKCFSFDTQILTEFRGWQLFKDLLPTDKVASLVDGFLYFVLPEEYFEGDYEGEMIGYQSKYLDFLVTPNHRCLVATGGNSFDQCGDWHIEEAQELYGSKRVYFNKEIVWEGVEDQYTEKHYELWGFWLGDGSINELDQVCITQKNHDHHVKNLMSVYKTSNIYDKESDGKILSIGDHGFIKWFIHHFGWLKSERRVPNWIKQATRRKQRAFIRGLFHVDDNCIDRYSESSGSIPSVDIYYKDLAEDIAEVAMKAGLGVTIKKSVKHYGSTRRVACWVVCLLKNNTHIVGNENHWYVENYKGKIYCVKVASGIILVRRNSLYHWSGNTFLAARLALWFLCCFKPSKVISTAPCYDDQTEILTNQGWKFFKDLTKVETVASLVHGKLEFVTPSDWLIYPVEGEMIGYHGHDIDFLVTPHHKLYVKPLHCENYKLIPAQDIYGQEDYQFSKEINLEKFNAVRFEKLHALLNFSNEINKQPIANKEHWTKEYYEGNVYCVTVPSGVVLVRRNGIYHWSGNTLRQVKDLLWKELRTAHQKAKVPLGGELLQLSLTFDDEHFGIGFSTDETNVDRFTGYHSPNQLVIFDQAAGISPLIWEAGEGLMTSENCHWLAISNTTISDSELANICMPDRKTRFGNWNLIKIRASESPNVVAGRNIYPGLISHDWVKKREEAWGKDDPLYQIFVEAEFVPSAQMSVVQYKYIVAAFENEGEIGTEIEVGVDVARQGLDSTVFVARTNSKVLEIYRLTGNNTMEVVGALIEFKRSMEEKYELPVTGIKIDVIGLGAGVYDRCVELSSETLLPVVAVNNAENPVTDTERYLNLRAELAWLFRRRMEQLQVGLKDVIVNDYEIIANLRQDISSMKYKISSNGKIQLWGKDALRLELGRSPDYWDALVMAFETPGGIPELEFVRGTEEKNIELLMSDDEWNAFMGISVNVLDNSFKVL